MSALLKLTAPRLKSPAVRRWQETLAAMGHDLGPYGPDGIFGPAVEAATKVFQKSAGISADGIVGPGTWAAADARLTSKPQPETSIISVINGVEIHDFRGKVPPPKNGRHMRDWSKISGVCLHRTACVLGENPKRYLDGNYHAAVTMGGKIILAHPWALWIGSAHNLSPHTINVEFDGNPAGVPGYWWRQGGGPHPITDQQVKAGDVLLEMLLKGFADHGQTWKHIFAHRQSCKDRESDPGHECWQKIALPWKAKTGANYGPVAGQTPTAGLTHVDLAGDTWGTGMQIPTEWDSASPIRFWKL